MLGIENVTQKLAFEKRMVIEGQTKIIDVYIPETRVLKVINPLFMDELKAELIEIKRISVERTKKANLSAFQRKLAQLKIFEIKVHSMKQFRRGANSF